MVISNKASTNVKLLASGGWTERRLLERVLDAYQDWSLERQEVLFQQLFERSLGTEAVPTFMQLCSLVPRPLFRKGSGNETSNYDDIELW